MRKTIITYRNIHIDKGIEHILVKLDLPTKSII